MTRLRRVVNNTVISLIGQIVTWTSTLLLLSAYGRFLGDFKFGELYFAITFVLLVGFPLEFGFNQQLTRDVAQDPSKALRYFSNTLLIKVTLWFALYGLILLLCWLLGYNTEERILVAIAGITLLSASIANTFAALHYAFERVLFPAVGTILEKGLSALIGIILLRHGAGVQAMALVLLGGSLIGATWQAIWFCLLVGSRFSIEPALIRELIRTSLPFLTYGVLGVIYYRLDTVLLSLFTNIAVVGWYGAAYRLFDTMVFLPNLVIMAIMYPVFSKLSTISEASLKLAIEKSMNFLLFCGIPIAGAMIAAAPNIIFILLSVAVLIYLGTATLLGTIPREDIKALYSSIRYKAQRTLPEVPVPQPEAEQDLQLNAHRRTFRRIHPVPQPEAEQDLQLNAHRRTFRRIHLVPQPETEQDLQTVNDELSIMEEVAETEIMQ